MSPIFCPWAPVKAPLFVAEELVLEERVAESGAVDPGQHPGSPGHLVHRLGQDLLAPPVSPMMRMLAPLRAKSRTVPGTPRRVGSTTRRKSRPVAEGSRPGRARPRRRRTGRCGTVGAGSARPAHRRGGARLQRGPVGGAEVLDRGRRTRPEDGMPPREAPVIDDHVAAVRPPDDHLPSIELVGGELPLAGHQKQVACHERRPPAGSVKLPDSISRPSSGQHSTPPARSPKPKKNSAAARAQELARNRGLVNVSP